MTDIKDTLNGRSTLTCRSARSCRRQLGWRPQSHFHSHQALSGAGPRPSQRNSRCETRQSHQRTHELLPKIYMIEFSLQTSFIEIMKIKERLQKAFRTTIDSVPRQHRIPAVNYWFPFRFTSAFCILTLSLKMVRCCVKPDNNFYRALAQTKSQ